MGPSFSSSLAELKLSELKITPSGSIREELKLLSAIAAKFFSRADVKVDSSSISNLTTLLLGMVRTYTTSRKVRVEEDWVLHILCTYKALLWRVRDVRPHVPFISRLFGPATHSLSLFNVAAVRSELLLVYRALAEHPSVEGLLMPSYMAMSKLTAADEQVIDGRDFAQCMPVFRSLSGEAKLSGDFCYTWDTVLGPVQCPTSRKMSLCTAVIFECLRCMNDSELVIRGASLAALKALMDRAAQWSGIIPSQDECVVLAARMDIVRTIVIPALRRGLKLGSDTVKKGYIELLSHIITDVGTHCTDPSSREMFHSDLAYLTNEDPEQDFFKNICHIQMHRRGRIMTKTRSLLDSYDVAENGSHPCPISSVSLVHVLLPLAMHPLISEDFKKKDHSAVLQEAASLTGAIARHLRWTQYYNLIKQLLKMLSHDRVDKERVLLAAVCAVLDSFHFEMKPSVTMGEGSGAEVTVDTVTEGADKGNVSDEDSDDDDFDHALEVAAPSAPVAPVAVSKDIPHIVLTSIIPWVRNFMLKDEKDHKGNKTQTVRTLVVVALVKLLKRLEPPIVSVEKINTQFTSLVMTIVGTLKSRDSSARDMARDSLARMVNTMGISSLYLVLHELQHSLGEGFQRHVRNYTLRSLLNACLTDYTPPVDAPTVPLVEPYSLEFNKDDIVLPDYDKCIPIMIQFCLDDLVGMTHEDRHVDGAVRTLIREAKGNKANEILEICSKHILFRPSYALCAMADPCSVSSVHAVVSPLLESLRNADSNGVVGRSSEALQRVAIGLSKNPSVEPRELLLYLHSTLSPFVTRIVSELRQKKGTLGAIVDANDTMEEEDELTANIPSYLNEEESDEEDAALYSEKKEDDTHKKKAQAWLPFDRKSVASQRQAVQERNEAQRALVEVQDGVHAPKLTGRNKHKKGSANRGNLTVEDDPSFNAAVKFCLSLLLSCLKQNKLDSQDEVIRSMAAPFLPLLGQCLRVSGNSTIVVLAMRCICALLSWGLSVEVSYSRAVGKRMLNMMYSGGATLSTDSELVQTCVKGLVSLFQLHQKNYDSSGSAVSPASTVVSTAIDNLLSTPNTEKREKRELPLEEESIRNLLSLLTTSILEVTSEYQNSAFQLIKLVVDMRIVVPEIYDLVNRLIEQIVLSHRKGVRETASNIVLHFVITYPLGKKRLDAHMKQFIQNCSYEYEEGRHAALSLLIDLCRLLPVPILDDYAQLIFLPIALQLVNDVSPSCREHAAQVIIALLRRASGETVAQCIDFASQWMGIRSNGTVSRDINRPLLRTGAQVIGLVVTARPDLVKRGRTTVAILDRIRCTCHMLLGTFQTEGKGNRRQSLQKREMTTGAGVVEGSGDGGGMETWSLLYHLLSLLERMLTHLPGVVDRTLMALEGESEVDALQSDDMAPILLEVVQEAMLFPHAWVRAAACRSIALYLKRRDPVAPRLGTTRPSSLSGEGLDTHTQKEFLLLENGVYSLARRLCVVINYPVISPTLLPSLVECLVFAIRAMHHHPEMCTAPCRSSAGDGEDGDAEEFEEDEGEDEDADCSDEDSAPGAEDKDKSPSCTESNQGGSNWVMQRLRAIGADSRGSRRLNVLTVSVPSSLCVLVSDEDVSL